MLTSKGLSSKNNKQGTDEGYESTHRADQWDPAECQADDQEQQTGLCVVYPARLLVFPIASRGPVRVWLCLRNTNDWGRNLRSPSYQWTAAAETVSRCFNVAGAASRAGYE